MHVPIIFTCIHAQILAPFTCTCKYVLYSQRCVKTGTEINYILCPMTNTAEAPTITTTTTPSLHYPPPPPQSTKTVRTQLCSTLQDGTIIIMTIKSLGLHQCSSHHVIMCSLAQ